MLATFVIVTLGAEMYVVCNGMLVTVLGPTLALNGPRSMERAVYLMDVSAAQFLICLGLVY